MIVHESLRNPNLKRGLLAVGTTPHVIDDVEAMLWADGSRLPVKGALEDFGWLIREGLKGISLDEASANAVISVVRGVPHTVAELVIQLDDDVECLLEDPADRIAYGFTEETAAELVQKLRALNSLQRLALARTARAAYALCVTKGIPMVDAFRELGMQVG